MEVSVENTVVVEGETLARPTFTLQNNGRSRLTLANQNTINATIFAESRKNQINFSGGSAKSTTIEGDNGKEIIKVADDSRLTGKSVMNLGSGKDKVVIDGVINRLTIDNGDDNARDKIELSSLDNIRKKLKIQNFGEKDRLIIEREVFQYQDVQDVELNAILKELGIVIALSDQ